MTAEKVRGDGRFAKSFHQARVVSPAVSALTDNPLFYWLLGSIALAMGLMVTGSDVAYSLLVGLFTLLTGITFHAAGGFRTIIGVCVLNLACQHVIISQVAKIIYNERADSPLYEPILTLCVYCAGMTSLLAGVYFLRSVRILEIPSALVPRFEPRWLLTFALLSTLAAFVRFIVVVAFSHQTGGIIGPIRSAVVLPSMAVAASTVYTICVSKGQRSLSWINAPSLLMVIIFGVLGAARSEMSFCLITYTITCLGYGYKLRLKHFACFALLAFIANVYLFPYALYARGFTRTHDANKNISVAWILFVDVVQDPQKYAKRTNTLHYTSSAQRRIESYFNNHDNSMNRYHVISSVDAIVSASQDKQESGWRTISPAIGMLSPGFLNPDKHIVQTSNLLAHSAKGLVGEEDRTTGITLGFFGDAYVSFRWVGIIVVPFLLLVGLSVATQRCFGLQLNRNFFALAAVIPIAWNFSEQTIAANMLSIEGVFISTIIYALFGYAATILSDAPRRKSLK